GGHLARVLEREFDLLAVQVQDAVLHGGLDRAVGLRRYSRKLRDLEIPRAEFLPEADDVIRLRAAHPQVLWTEIPPVLGDALIQLICTYPTNALCLGR